MQLTTSRLRRVKNSLDQNKKLLHHRATRSSNLYNQSTLSFLHFQSYFYFSSFQKAGEHFKKHPRDIQPDEHNVPCEERKQVGLPVLCHQVTAPVGPILEHSPPTSPGSLSCRIAIKYTPESGIARALETTTQPRG